MKRRGILFDVKNEYDTPDIMIGASMNLKSAADLEKVKTVPGVRHIQPVLRIRRPLPVHHTTIESPNDPNVPKNALSTHLMTGVDKVHAKGLFGEGIRIGIVDTGVDYTHPSLGGKLGKGHKVIGGHDFVGDHYNGTNDPTPDEDPLDQCSGHGTHSAGIIGADPGNIFGISGVAYKASLGVYLDISTSVPLLLVIVGALIRAYNDGMDVITLSLGGVDGWTEGMGSVVASRIASHGRVVIVAAGNGSLILLRSNAHDIRTTDYASSVDDETIRILQRVRSVRDNVVIPTQNITVKGVEHNPISYLQALPLNVTDDLPIYATSNDTTSKNDACEPLPPSTPDLSSHIVVIRRGGCFFTQKLDNAAKFGAKTFLIYNTDDGEFSGIAVGNYTAVLITADDGKWLVNQYAAGAPLRLHFPAEGAPFNIPDPKGGLVSSFSSYGPTYDMYFKPALVAPGGNILSTYNTKNGSWAVRSGTSMAAPFVAGASALFLEAKGKSRESVERMRDLMQTTAVGVKSNVTEDSVYQTASQQGAGLLQVDRAIWTKTIVRPGQLMLNDTVNFVSTHTISISNSYDHPVTYKLSHVPAGTALTIQANSSEPSKGPVPLVPAFATAEIQPSEVTIRPGHSKDVTIKFAPPSNVNPKQLPVYSGFIRIASSDEALKVTYLGAVGSLRAEPIIDQTEQYFGPGIQLPIVLDADALPQFGELNYTMDKHDYPSVAYRLTFGSPLVRLDLVDKDFTLQKHAKTKRSAMWFEDAGDKDTVPTLGPLDILRYTPRNGYDAEPKLNGYNHYTFRGFFANRTRVDNGQYRILLRSLRVTGDRNSEADTESWLSPVIGVNHQPIPL
ncbi:hypothetical protein CCMSSC00406_0004288 [Pleurotus cornucopiae]|uniref:Uncharacterized protein n=1 Tax=Pleurotus cornucopiae TaxID=5321 RepID=A0ACB7JCP1_PLECO|nr:hypothetical protein CCMSSC00406_0004288 [Pleurotus cornucopiae]